MAGSSAAQTRPSYKLIIEKKPVFITNKPLNKITVNGGIPGPTLTFQEGDEAIIEVVNHLSVPTSVHWHGLLLPPSQDGVDGFGGYQAIKPGQSFTYRFPLRQAGTYWYHAHSGGQEQDGLYGAIIIKPKTADTYGSAQDQVVLFSDFHEDNAKSIMNNLKRRAEFYATGQITLKDRLKQAQKSGMGATVKDAQMWGAMNMMMNDLADVSGYEFLINGQTKTQNWTLKVAPNALQRLRLINGSAMTIFDIRIPGLRLEVIEADGMKIKPIFVDGLRLAPGETIDALVKLTDNQAVSLSAEPIDRTGQAMGTITTIDGLKPAPLARLARTRLNLKDMGHNQDETHNHHNHHNAVEIPKTGWAAHWLEEDQKILALSDLQSKDPLIPSIDKPETIDREIEIRLGGNMKRYIWTMNGKPYDLAPSLDFAYGETVRIVFINETMMAHPMHLHGLYFRVENGSPPAFMPKKHTLLVPPGTRQSVILKADEPGEWAFHCHLLYHMNAGMMRKVIIDTEPPPKSDAPLKPSQTNPHEGHHGHH